MDDVIVRYLDRMPTRVGGVTVMDENGDYNVYLNSKWGYNGQMESMEHEEQHIEGEDFTNALSILDVERIVG